MARTGGSISGRRRRRGTTGAPAEPAPSTALVELRHAVAASVAARLARQEYMPPTALVPAERRAVVDAEIVTKREHVNALAGTRTGKFRSR